MPGQGEPAAIQGGLGINLEGMGVALFPEAGEIRGRLRGRYREQVIEGIAIRGIEGKVVARGGHDGSPCRRGDGWLGWGLSP